MIKAELEKLLSNELHRIAPEILLDEIDKDEDLREECDIDSVDFLNLITAIGKALNANMPETDYQFMTSFNAMVAYMEKKSN